MAIYGVIKRKELEQYDNRGNLVSIPLTESIDINVLHTARYI